MICFKLWGLVLLRAAITIAASNLEQQQQPIILQGQPGLGQDTNIFNNVDGPTEWKQQCKEHRVTAHETVDGVVHFGPRNLEEHPALEKLSGINSTSWEQWVFDSVSETGSSGVFLSLGRDASYASFGQGNLHVEFYALLDDGTKIQELAFVDESSVFDCGDFVASVWTSRSHSFEFRINRGVTTGATFSVRMPKFQGTFVLRGTAPGHFPDGSLQASSWGSTQVAPGLHMHDTISAAEVRGNMSVKGRGGKMTSSSYSGVGGHLHLWAIDNWFKIIWAFRIIRGTAGPYSFFYWEPISRFGGRVPFYTGILFKDGKKLVSSQVNPQSDQQGDEDYVHVSATHRGRGAQASVAGRSTGHVVEFWSTQKGEAEGVRGHWRFELEHQYVQIQMPFGGDTGIAVFTNRVFGGEVGGCQYLGSAFSEEAEFPEVLAQWKIWLVYGVGMLSQLKAQITNWLVDSGFGALL